MHDLKILISLSDNPNMKMWKIAEVIGIGEATLYRWMRTFDADHHQKILEAINKIEEGEQD